MTSHIPTQNCLSDCLTKASAKADKSITVVKTGRLLGVDIHPDFFQCNLEKMRATYEDAYTRARFDYCRRVFPQSVRKAGTNVDLYNVSTYQCSLLFNNMGSFNRGILISRFLQMKSSTLPADPQLSLLTEFCRNNYAHVFLTAEADSLPTDARKLLNDYGLLG